MAHGPRLIGTAFGGKNSYNIAGRTDRKGECDGAPRAMLI